MEPPITYRRLVSLLILLAVGLLYAGEYFNLPRIKLLVVLGFGLFTCFRGIRFLLPNDALIGQAWLNKSNDDLQYDGLAAKLMGGILVVCGLWIVGLDLLEIFSPGSAGAFLNRLSSSPAGLASLVGLAGIFMIVFGVIRIISASKPSHDSQTRWIELKAKASGTILALVGLILIFGSIWSAFSPGWLQTALERILNSLVMQQN
jgi:hypothetical protein